MINMILNDIILPNISYIVSRANIPTMSQVGGLLLQLPDAWHTTVSVPFNIKPSSHVNTTSAK